MAAAEAAAVAALSFEHGEGNTTAEWEKKVWMEVFSGRERQTKNDNELGTPAGVAGAMTTRSDGRRGVRNAVGPPVDV